MSRFSRIRRKWWLMYTIGAAFTLVALVVVTCIITSVEQSARTARAEASRHETLRLALWRLDSWLTPLIAMEAARPYFEFEASYSRSRAYPHATNLISPKEERWPSPLLTFESQYIALHFQVDESGAITSPQVPESGELAPQFITAISSDEMNRRRTLLSEIRNWVGPEELAQEIIDVEACFANILNSGEEVRSANPPLPNLPPITDPSLSEMQTFEVEGGGAADGEYSGTNAAPIRLGKQLEDLDYRKRAGLSNQSQTVTTEPFNTSYQSSSGRQRIAQADANRDENENDDEVSLGPLVPLWLSVGDWEDLQAGTAEPVLTYVRRVNIRGRTLHQGFVLRWWNVTSAMRDEISDLLPDSTIEPWWEGFGLEDPPDLALATMPAVLKFPGHIVPVASVSSGTILTIVIAWTTVLLAIGGVGFALHGGISFGEKRSRFASAVTHELRTPLTTFRMYSEMLAQHMVPEDQIDHYLATLDRESQRLETLVNNVLAYARLEEGRSHLDRSLPCTLKLLIGPIESRLAGRCAESGMRLMVIWNVDPETVISTDPEAVGQILFNLIENACKYGRSDECPQVEVTLDRASGGSSPALNIMVRDYGAGIDDSIRACLFQPFERGHGHPSLPGIGLGLALSRGLARDLGGDLVLDPTDAARRGANGNDAAPRGAVFRLSLPALDA